MPPAADMATEAMNESWRRIRDQVKSIWDDTEFDDKEMKRARGDMDKIVRLIHNRTGEPREDIYRKMGAIL
jgi:hypothetical protein